MQIKQRGVALFLFLALVMVAMTVTLIGRVSVTDIKLGRQSKNQAVLAEAERLLIGYALRHTTVGTLPCPAAAIDGISMTDADGCAQTLGFFPYQTLGVRALYDANGALLIYGVDERMAENNTAQVNSSLIAALSVDGSPALATLIAPGASLNDLARNIWNATAFLEGTNGDGDLSTYEQSSGEDQNDTIRALRPITFWSLVEKSVANSLGDILNQYAVACNEYPWAANFGSANSGSVSSQQSGAFPIDSALPFDWNEAGQCSDGISISSVLADNWEGEIYYQFCLVSEGTCLDIVDTGTQSARAVLIMPGIATSTQNRPSLNLTDYFELDNAVNNTQFTRARLNQFDDTFNDVIHALSP